jgi:hypothetical protein
MATAELKPETVTGVSLSVVELSPSSPSEFRPQHFASPELKSAQDVQPLAEIATAELMPETVTGVELLINVLLPS